MKLRYLAPLGLLAILNTNANADDFGDWEYKSSTDRKIERIQKQSPEKVQENSSQQRYDSSIKNLMEERKYDSAIEQLNQAIKKEPNSESYKNKLKEIKKEASVFHYNNGVTYYKTGDSELAAKEFRLSIQYDNCTEAKKYLETILKEEKPSVKPGKEVQKTPAKETKKLKQKVEEKQVNKKESLDSYISRLNSYEKDGLYGHALATMLKIKEGYGKFDQKRFDKLKSNVMQSTLYSLSISVKAENNKEIADILRENITRKINSKGLPGLKSITQDGNLGLEARVYFDIKTTQESETKQKEIKTGTEWVPNPEYLEAKEEVERKHQEFMAAKQEYLAAKSRQEESKKDSLIGGVVDGVLTGNWKRAGKSAGAEYLAKDILGNPSEEEVNKAEKEFNNAKSRRDSTKAYITQTKYGTVNYEETTVKKIAVLDLDYGIKAKDGNNISQDRIHEEKNAEDITREAVPEAGITSKALHLPSDSSLTQELINETSSDLTSKLINIGGIIKDSYYDSGREVVKNSKNSDALEMFTKYVVASDKETGIKESIEFIKSQFGISLSWLEIYSLLNEQEVKPERTKKSKVEKNKETIEEILLELKKNSN